MNSVEYKDLQQGTPEWHAVRCGRITASEADDFFGSETAFTKLLYKKAAEILTGVPRLIKTTADMERGHEMESRARILYEIRNGVKIRETGFFAVDDFFGLSPDGLIEDTDGWESKAINQTDHLQMHETGKGCKDHASHEKQCKFSIYFSERQRWHLFYYHNLFPNDFCTTEFEIELDSETRELIVARAERAVEFLTKYKLIMENK